jgi:hypothetical protein
VSVTGAAESVAFCALSGSAGAGGIALVMRGCGGSEVRDVCNGRERGTRGVT